MELRDESTHLDVAEDNYKLVPLRDNLLLLHGPRYVNVIKLGDSVLFSRQLDDTNKRNIFRYLHSTNKLLHVGKDNTVRILSPTHQGIFVLGDALNDSVVRLSFQEAIYLLEVLQNSDMNWGPDTEDISQRVEVYLQNRVPELQMQPQKKQQWLECALEGTYADLEPLFEDIASQSVQDSPTITKMLQRLRYNASNHLKHPSHEPVVSATVSPTEEIVVTASADGSIAIWDISKTPRLVNTISGPDGLVDVLLGAVVFTVHKPNTVVVHQIGEHALSETLFQQNLEGVVIVGAAYVPSTQKVVLAMNVIGSPSKECYFLQTAFVNLDDSALDLGDRVRVEGSFVGIAATNGTNVVAIDAEGRVVLYDSSSSVISNTLQKPQSNYRFSDVTSSNGHVYATTLGGTVLSFDLATIPRNSAQPSFQETGNTEPFSDFSSSQAPGGNDDEFGFGDFSSAPATNGSTPHNNSTFSADDDEFGFGKSPSFGSPTSFPLEDQSNPFSMEGPGAGIAGSVAGHNSSTGDFGELPGGPGSIQNSPMIGTSKLRQSYEFQDSPYSSPQLQRKSPPTAPEFGDFGFQQSSPSLQARKSPPPATASEFGDFGFQDSPSQARNSPTPTATSGFGDFGFQENTSPHARKTPSPTAASNLGQIAFQDSPSQARKSPPPNATSGFGDFGFQDSQRRSPSPTAASNLGAIAFQDSSPTRGSPSPTNASGFGDFGFQDSQRKSPSHTAASNLGAIAFQDTPTRKSPSPTNALGDFGLSNTSPSAARKSPSPFGSQLKTSTSQEAFSDFGSSQQFGDFGTQGDGQFSDFTQEQFGEAGSHGDFGTQGQFGDFGAIPSSTSQSHQSTQEPKDDTGNFSDFSDFTQPSGTPQSTTDTFGDFTTTVSTPPTLAPSHSSSTPNHSAPSTPALHSSNFRVSSSILPNSPSIFSQDFAFDAPPPTSLSQSGPYSPPTTRQTTAESFGDFGTADFASTAHQSPPKSPLAGARSPKSEPETSGDFGELASSSTVPQGGDDFSFGDDFVASSTTNTNEEFGDFGTTQPNNATAQPSDEFDDFGQTTPATQTGDFGNTAPSASTFDFGDNSTSKDEDGDFGESPATQPSEGFGDFGQSPTPQASDSFEGDFTNFTSTQSNEAAGANDFEDFSDFSAPVGTDQQGDDDDFGFGDFSKPQDNDQDNDEDFGFGAFSGAPSTENQADFDEPEVTPPPVTTPVPIQTPIPTPQTPSIFSQDEKQLSATLTDTFSTAFAPLIPPSLSSPSSPSSRRSSVLAGLDLEASLKRPDNDSALARNPKCTQCGVVLRSADAPSCLACGALAGPPQVSTWLGVVLPPIAEIKFWDALGVPLKQMTETAAAPPALSSSQGILTPMTSSTPSLNSTQPTQQTLSSSWGFSDNPFSPTNKTTNFEFDSAAELFSATTTPAAKPAASPATPSASVNATTNANAKPAQHATQPPVTQGGFSDSDFMAGSPFATPSTAPTTKSTPTTNPTAGTTRTPAPNAPPRSADDEFFLSFESSQTATPAKPPPSILTTPSLASSSSSTTPWSQFLSRIPDLSFAIADKLTVPSH